MQWVQRDDRDGKQTQTLDRTQDGVPSRTDGAGENPAPDKRQPEDAHPAEKEIELLHPSGGAEAE
jgi:hypothetical protein